MKLNLRVINLLIVIGICSFSSTVLAQKNKTTKTQASAEAEANKTKATKPKNDRANQTPKINISKGNNRPASTGTGNGNNRPASTGETLSERDRIERTTKLLLFAATFPNGTVEDLGANLARTRSFIEKASENAWILKNRYINANNQSVNYESDYSVPNRSDMNDVKNNLQQALNYLNAVNFETEQNHRALAIDFTGRAIRQIEAYLINPPSPAKTIPTKKARNGAKVKQTSTSSESERMVNSNGIDTSLKPNSAAQPGKAKKNKNTNETAKSNGKMTKPTENLFPLDDPWGKSSKKPKKKN